MTHRFREYAPFKGHVTERMKGSLISMESGVSTPFSIGKLQDRGRFFISPGDNVYKGQVIGENSRDNDLDINVIKGKQLTNMRKSGSDAAVQIAPKIDFSLEQSMEYIQVDEYLEVTPLNLKFKNKGEN
jgi:GTP-binding protein